ncbi:hypothetical protein [Streptomyces sp. NPDC000410]|uniref:hypothetical protein n=1 Tax=Streptomyces sp. NPDC000410 TaxID=3154254 RepID=UPI0033256E13
MGPSPRGAFREKLSISALTIDGALGAVSLDYWDSTCSPNCNGAYAGTWDAPTTWTGLGDTHWASATKTFTWTLPTAGTAETFDRGTFLNFKAANPQTVGAIPVEKPEWVFFDQVRCDSIIGTNSTGCVFEKHIPTFTTNTKRYPAAAAYYWIMREKLSWHPGSKAHKTPMHREADSVVSDKSRQTICRKTGAFAYVEHPDATSDTSGLNCDEFPFAATKESGGQSTPLLNGGACVQLFAKKDGDGKWRLYDDERPPYTAPTWGEPCGRATMPGKQNQDAGRGPGLSGFYTKARVLDNGPFYIDVPELSGCNVDEVCVIRP